MLSLSCFVLATDTVHGCLFDWNKVGITVLPPSHRRSKPRTWPCLSARCSGPDAGSGTALSLPSQDMTTSRFVPDAADTATWIVASDSDPSLGVASWHSPARHCRQVKPRACAELLMCSSYTRLPTGLSVLASDRETVYCRHDDTLASTLLSN